MVRAICRSIAALVLTGFVSQKFVGCLAKPNRQDLILMGGLMMVGKVKPVIDRTYKLSETSEAIRYLETGNARGKVLIVLE
jgi:NADPH:quinone reductase-like Zn-dependent oxidoreductase